MKTISIVNIKGGVGKTTSVVTLGHILATAHNKRVLLVDMDSQGNLTSMFLDNNYESNKENLLTDRFVDLFQSILLDKEPELVLPTDYSIVDVLRDKESDPHLAVTKTKYSNLDIIPAFITLANIEKELRISDEGIQQLRLTRQLKKLEDDYDYCLIDCSTTFGLLNINAVTASDYVLIPLKPDAWSAYGVQLTRNLLKQSAEAASIAGKAMHLMGCFLTMYNENRTTSSVIETTCKALLEPARLYIDSPIRLTTALEKMTYNGRMIFDNIRFKKGLSQVNPVAEDYYNLSKYIVENS